MRNVVLVIAFLLISLNQCIAQQDVVGDWLMYFGTFKIKEKYSIHNEFQFRNHTLVPNNTEQLLFRVGLNKNVAKNAMLTAGYGYVLSYDYQSETKSPESKEHRIWQQFITTNQYSRIKLEHRYRIEQRWTDDAYKNRFRYRLMLFLPLNKKIIEPNVVFLGLYDEIFINGKSNFFDRNRLYGALGYQINHSSSVQLGVLHQQVSNFGKFYMQCALVYSPRLIK